MIKDTLGNYTELLDEVISNLEQVNLASPYICDHICYRAETYESYAKLKPIISNFSEDMGETIVSKRPISIFKLNGPIQYKGLSIDCIELAAPKEKNTYSEGWEHVEFVVKDINDFINDNKDLNLDLKSINRKVNPEIGLKISEKFQIKFHPLHILDVLKREKELGIESVC